MATLPTASFATMVSNIVAGIQGRASKLINFAIGSTLRAIAEGFAGLFLFFQALVLQLLTATRLSTSSGVDVDTFTADFMTPIGVSNGVSSPRLGAQAASGQVTFGRFTAAPSSCFIPVGATVQTADGSQNYAVTADATNTAYSAVLGGYTLPAAVATVSVPVAAVVPGAAGNVTIGAITTMTSPVTGIDYVVNSAAFTNGADQESDTSLKARFAAYILGLARGDIYGLTASIEGTAVTVEWTLTENYNFDGSVRYGYFFVVADDGSGSPSTAFLNSVSAAVQAVRPLGIQAAVFGPTIVIANVTMQVATAAGYDHNTVVAQVIAKVTAGINGLGLGNPLPYSLLSSWAYSVPGVTSVTGILLNGSSGDGASLVATRNTLDGFNKIADRTIRAGTIIVS
jgi:uncharacterized phage protein gp47/JayE